MDRVDQRDEQEAADAERRRRRRLGARLSADGLVASLSGLALEVEGADFSQDELAVSPEFRRVTTTVRLRGGGHEGLGEDVTYQPELHEHFPLPEVAGSWTVGSFSDALEGVSWFDREPLDHAAFDYRRWAWESAALDLALAQAGSSLGEALGRTPGPLTYVVSTRVGNVEPLLERYPSLRFKLDPASDWDDATIDRLAARHCVDTADFKGVFRGDFGQPPNPRLYRRIAEAFPEAWLEDPGLDEATDEVLRPHRDRVTWDAPIHSAADAEALPFPPRCLNVKPSRFGTVARLFGFYEWCESRGVRMYGGGQFELGVGRLQIQELASLFHPEMPNDVAPGVFNAAAVPEDVPLPPLPPPRAFGAKPAA